MSFDEGQEKDTKMGLDIAVVFTPEAFFDDKLLRVAINAEHNSTKRFPDNLVCLYQLPSELPVFLRDQFAQGMVFSLWADEKEYQLNDFARSLSTFSEKRILAMVKADFSSLGAWQVFHMGVEQKINWVSGSGYGSCAVRGFEKTYNVDLNLDESDRFHFANYLFPKSHGIALSSTISDLLRGQEVDPSKIQAIVDYDFQLQMWPVFPNEN